MPDKRKRNVRKEKKVREKHNIRERVTEILELPKEIILDIPKITMIGNTNLLLENYKGIVEYDDDKIRINTTRGIIKISGDKLIIKEITSEDLMVSGDICALEFLK